jgi:hypothetical protein
VTDQDIVIAAVEEAKRILAEYIEPSRVTRLPDVTLNHLLRVLDRKDVVSALSRLKAGYGLRVVK